MGIRPIVLFTIGGSSLRRGAKRSRLPYRAMRRRWPAKRLCPFGACAHASSSEDDALNEKCAVLDGNRSSRARIVTAARKRRLRGTAERVLSVPRQDRIVQQGARGDVVDCGRGLTRGPLVAMKCAQRVGCRRPFQLLAMTGVNSGPRGLRLHTMRFVPTASTGPHRHARVRQRGRFGRDERKQRHDNEQPAMTAAQSHGTRYDSSDGRRCASRPWTAAYYRVGPAN